MSINLAYMKEYSDSR